MMLHFIKKIGLDYCLIFLLGISLTLSVGQFNTMQAQGIIRPEDTAAIVYQKFPEIPLENQYVRQETGKVDPEHTLMSRMVRYHRDVQRRIMRYRFDWKLTFADYLGVNEPMKADRYPGSDTLTENPMQKDIKVINQFTRRQRLELVDLLSSIYAIEKPESLENTGNSPEKEPEPSPSPPTPSKPPLSQPGDAQLLQ